jgi:signal transduction histidine kinase
MLEFLSHDIRSPQVAILSLARVGLRKSGGQSALFERIRVHAQRGLQLADNFLHLARIGVVPLARTTVRLGALVDQAIDSVAESANEAAMSVSKAIGNEMVVLNCDAELVVRAIENLLLNAIVHARRPGGIVSVRQKAVTRGGIRFARIEVADDGPGLDATRTMTHLRDLVPIHAWVRRTWTCLHQRGGSQARWAPSLQSASGGGSLFALELPMRPMNKV